MTPTFVLGQVVYVQCALIRTTSDLQFSGCGEPFSGVAAL